MQLQVGDETYNETFEIQNDPNVKVSQEDLQAQFVLLSAIRDKISEAYGAINTIRNIKKQVEGWEERTKGNDVNESVIEAGKTIKQKLTAIEEVLLQTKTKDQMDTLDHPIRLAAKFASLAATVGSANAAPTRSSEQVFQELSSRLAAQLKALREIIDTDVAAFNKLIRDANLAAIIPSSQKPS